MGRRGPKPVPTSVLALRGSWRADARKGEPQPEPLDDVPTPPKWVGKPGVELWQELAKPLLDAGVLTTWDVQRFAAMCRAWSDYVLACTSDLQT